MRLLAWIPWTLIAVAPLLAEVSPEVPHDHSLTVEEYISMGMPDPQATWSVDDREKARTVLKQLWTEDPTLLPRAGSPRSGAMFAKLLDEYLASLSELMSVDEVVDSNPEERQELVLQRSLLAVYMPPHDVRLLYDRELVEIQAGNIAEQIQIVDRLKDSMRVMQESQTQLAELGETAYPMPEVDTGESLMLLVIQLAVLASSEDFSPTARRAGLEHLERLAPAVSARLRPEQQEALDELVESVRRELMPDALVPAHEQAAE